MGTEGGHVGDLDAILATAVAAVGPNLDWLLCRAVVAAPVGHPSEVGP